MQQIESTKDSKAYKFVFPKKRVHKKYKKFEKCAWKLFNKVGCDTDNSYEKHYRVLEKHNHVFSLSIVFWIIQLCRGLQMIK